MLKKDFKIFIFNNVKNSSNLVYDYMIEHGYDCINSDDIQDSYRYIKQNKLDLLIINSDQSTIQEKQIIEQIQNISDVKIIFLTGDVDIKIKEEFTKFNLLEYKIKLNNILIVVEEIDILIEKLILNIKETILIIKNKTVVRDKIESLLLLRNYNLIISSSGTHGWKEINQNSDISLIILDISLKDMDSLEIINKAKRKYSKNIPIIALTKTYNHITLQQNISNGLNDLLKIPIINEEFNLKIDLWMDNIRQKREICKKQQQLKQTLIGFQALANATIEGLIMFDENNICVDANNEALILFKYTTKQDLIGQHILKIVPQNLSDFDKDELLKKDVDHEFELNMCKKDGTIFPTHIKERNLILEDKHLKVIAILDLTDIKRKESMLNQQSKMASMGEMMGNIAHQWRQPLTAISIAASGIKLNKELDILEDEEMFEQLDNIVSSTEFLSNTINDFQSFLKGNQKREDFELEDIIKRVLILIEGNLKSSDVTVIQEYKNSFHVFGIANEVLQSVLNIINNAKDALKEQDNTLKLILIKVIQDKYTNNAILTIQDSAGGIPKKIIDKIFEPYFTTKHQSQGTGLGLYMTHQIIVDNMKGKLEVKNKEFIYKEDVYFGAEFKIILPLN